MAQCLIRPGSGPKRRPTLFTPVHATCSLDWPNGDARPGAWQPCASRAPLPLPRACLSVSPPRALRLQDRAPELSTSFLTHSLDRCSLLASLRAACDRHGRAPSSPAPRCFPLLAPPRSSRATPSASPPSPARRARARRPKPRWEHCSRRPPSLPTAGAHGRSTTDRLSAIQDHQRVREDTLVLLLHFPAAVKPPPAISGELPCLPCCVLRPGASGSNSIK